MDAQYQIQMQNVPAPSWLTLPEESPEESYEPQDFSSDEMISYLNEIGKSRLLSEKEEIVLSERVKAGCREAKEKFVNANLKLVVSMVKKYSRSGMNLVDLIQEGNKGLMVAVEKFDATRGHRFSTHACWWIRQAITRAIANYSRTIRVPVHVHARIGKVQRAYSSFKMKTGRDPSTQEIASEIRSTKEQVEEAIRCNRKPHSLQKTAASDDDIPLQDFIKDSMAADPEDVVAEASKQKTILEALDSLTEKEAKIIRHRYGIGGIRPLTLAEIGLRFGITRERVRQIEARALARLRHPTRANVLRTLM